MDIQILRDFKYQGVDYGDGLYTAARGNVLSNAADLVAQGYAIDLTPKFPIIPITNIFDVNGQPDGLNVNGVKINQLSHSLNRSPTINDNTSRGYASSDIWVANGRLWICTYADSNSAVWQEQQNYVTGGADIGDIVGATNVMFAGGFTRWFAAYGTGAAMDLSVIIATVPTAFTINFLASGLLDWQAFYSAMAKADTGSLVSVTKLYDHSGKGNHYTKNAGYAAPILAYSQKLKSWVITTRVTGFAGGAGNLIAPTGTTTTGFFVPSQNHSLVMVGEANTSASTTGLCSITEVGDYNNTWGGGNSRGYELQINNSSGLNYQDIGQFNQYMNPSILHLSPSVLTLNSSGNNLTLNQNESQWTGNSTASVPLVSGWLFGRPSVNPMAGFALTGYLLTNVALTTAQAKAIRYALYPSIGAKPQKRDRVWLTGDSRIDTALPSSNHFCNIGQKLSILLNDTHDVYNLGQNGGTSVTHAPLHISYMNSNKGLGSNDAFYLWGVNDFIVSNWTAAQSYAQHQVNIASLKGYGFKTNFINELATTSVTNNANTRVPQLQALVRAGGVGADNTIDLQQSYTIINQTGNTAVYADGLHPTEGTDEVISSILLPYVNTTSYAKNTA